VGFVADNGEIRVTYKGGAVLRLVDNPLTAAAAAAADSAL
jgi:hypothetical protein